MELESKLSNLNDKLIQVRINVDDLIKSIEDIGVTKNKVCILLKGINYINKL